MTKAKLLCVDDESNILKGMALNLRRYFDVTCAESGAEGLRVLDDAKEPFAVVLSDMKMPQMNGAEFLGNVRSRFPDATRLLLTGYSEMESAIAAVNEGGIFRFLTKPCGPAELRTALEDAAEQYRLRIAEKELLEQTLRGAVETMAQALTLANPEAFGRVDTLRSLVRAVAPHLGLEAWDLEIAMVLSQLGWASVPQEIAEAYREGRTLDSEAQSMIDDVHRLSAQLIEALPRVEGIQAIVSALTHEPYPDDSESTRLLRLLLDYEYQIGRGVSEGVALEILEPRTERYGEGPLRALRLYLSEHADLDVCALPVDRLTPGMVLADDLRNREGVLLMTKGTPISAGVLARLQNLATQEVIHTVGIRKIE